jgi:hypothetical protein
MMALKNRAAEYPHRRFERVDGLVRGRHGGHSGNDDIRVHNTRRQHEVRSSFTVPLRSWAAFQLPPD